MKMLVYALYRWVVDHVFNFVVSIRKKLCNFWSPGTDEVYEDYFKMTPFS